MSDIDFATNDIDEQEYQRLLQETDTSSDYEGGEEKAATTYQGRDVHDPDPNPQEEQEEGKNFIQQGLDNASNIISGDAPLEQRAAEFLGSVNPIGMGAVDFGMDAIGRIPGAQWIDDAWDEKTRYRNKGMQNVRETLSIVVPSVAVGLGAAAATPAVGAAAGLTGVGAAVTKGLASLGIAAVGDVAVTGISDQAEEHNMLHHLDKAFPDLNIPNNIKTLDSDSPDVRRQKNMYEAAGMSIMADMLGVALGMGKGAMGWFKPKSPAAKAFKDSAVEMSMDDQTAKAIQSIDEALEVTDDPIEAAALQGRRRGIVDEVEEVGISEFTENPVDSYVARQQLTREIQTDEIGTAKLIDDPESVNFDPDITARVSSEASVARQSVPDGAVARNMADIAAIKSGASTGDPAPIITDPMLREGLAVPEGSREVVKGIMEQARDIGDFDAVIDGFRFSRKEMSDGAWKIYSDVMNSSNVDEVKKLFINRRDTKNLIDSTVTYINEEQALGAAYAIRDLVDTFLGSDVIEASGRAMGTTAKEISTISEAGKVFSDVADEARINEMVLDKVQFLMNEYGLNKYVSGWQLRNKKWWATIKNAAPDDVDEFLGMTAKEFNDQVTETYAKNKSFIDNLKQLAEEDGSYIKPLIDAYALSDGDVTTIDALNNWAWKQLTPTGMLKQPDGVKGMNLFAKGMWAVRYNNVLSGLSAFRAGIGNASSLMFRMGSAWAGAGMEYLFRGDTQAFKRTAYEFGSFFETNRRAFTDAAKIWKKANIDPTSIGDIARQDLVIKETTLWETLGDMAKKWEADGDWGKANVYRWAKFNHDIANTSWMRWGTNGMVGVDAFTQTTLANQIARRRAYDDVFSKNGFVTKELLAKAEAKNYATMFTQNGNITDDAVRNATGEIALNLDSPLSDSINKTLSNVPALKPFFMFPRTGINTVKLALSYTPLQAIPGISRHAKVLYAGDDIVKISEALAEHGIDFATDPNAMAIYKGLRAEYQGRLAMGAAFTYAGFQYALGGNIRSNLSRNPAERRKQKSLGMMEKTINIGGKWVSYGGIEPLDSLLSIAGDAAMYANDLGENIIEDIQTKVMWTISATFVNKTLFAQIEPLQKAMNGEEGALKRLFANEVRSYIPLSGALGVASNAITSSLKDIHNDMWGYLGNRLPGISSTLPEQFDIWTGQPINDIEDPILRMMNALSPIKVSHGTEPWRLWLQETQWYGFQDIFSRHSSGYEYTAEERSAIQRMIGEQNLKTRIKEIMNSKRVQDEMQSFRDLRARGVTSDAVEGVQLRKSYTHDKLNKMAYAAKKLAEERLIDEQPAIQAKILQALERSRLTQQAKPRTASVTNILETVNPR